MDTRILVDRYFEHVRGTTGDDAFDVVEEVDELARADPMTAWKVVRALVDAAPSDDALSYIAAGPLEILLRMHGETVVSRIRHDAERNERVAEALRHVLVSEQELSARVRAELSRWLTPVG